jgi:regulator of cell morphogenesis and NO signaling
MSEVILNNPYLLLLLEHFDIEIPLQEKTLQEVCQAKKINTDVFLTFANLYNGVNYTPEVPFSFHDIQTIIGYLQNSHRYYSEEIYPNIQNTIRQMFKVNNHHEIVLVEKFFNQYFGEVTEHLNYENKIVFPYILGLFRNIEENTTFTAKVDYSVTEYKDHHNDIQEKLTDLKNLAEALSEDSGEQDVCQLLTCPRLAILRGSLNESVQVLEKTKNSFKSKELGDLRKRLEALASSMATN